MHGVRNVSISFNVNVNAEATELIAINAVSSQRHKRASIIDTSLDGGGGQKGGACQGPISAEGVDGVVRKSIDAAAAILLAWCHFRKLFDKSLRFSVLREIRVLLFHFHFFLFWRESRRE